MATQSEQKEKFYSLCHKIMGDIEEIDLDTPYSETEPMWWKEMMELYRAVQDIVTE